MKTQSFTISENGILAAAYFALWFLIKKFFPSKICQSETAGSYCMELPFRHHLAFRETAGTAGAQLTVFRMVAQTAKANINKFNPSFQ